MSTSQNDSTAATDSELVRRARSGDNSAFGEIFRRYWSPVHATAWAQLHFDKDAADDAAAEVFLGVVKSRFEGFRDNGALKPYLCRIAQRRAVDQVRPRSGKVSQHYTEQVPEVAAPDAPTLDLESEAHMRWLSLQFTACLSEDERTLFALWVREQSGTLTRSETAELLGTTPMYAGTRIARLRAKLAKIGAVIAMVHKGDFTHCANLAKLVPETPSPDQWPALVEHVAKCGSCSGSSTSQVDVDRVLATLGVAAIAAAHAGRFLGTATVSTAAGIGALGPLLSLLNPAQAGAATAETAAGGAAAGAGSAKALLGIGGSLAVAGTVVALVLLSPAGSPEAVPPPSEPTSTSAPAAPTSTPTTPPTSPSNPPPGSGATTTNPPESGGVSQPPSVAPEVVPPGERPNDPRPGEPRPQPTPAPVTQPATWGHWQVRWAADPGTRELAPSAQHPGNEESNWTSGEWALRTPAEPRRATVTRLGTGRHVVVLPGIGAPGGIAHVTANDFQAVGASCQPLRWWKQGVDQAIEVVCFDRAGGPADVPFTGLFLAGHADTERGYVHADNPAASAYLPGNRHNSGTVTRTGVGRYTVATGQADAVQVTPVGATRRHCAITDRTTRSASIACFTTDATPADTVFTLSHTHAGSLIGEPRRPHGAHARIGPTGTVDHAWVSKPGQATVTRTGLGRYTVRFPVGLLPSYTQVTAVGGGYCTLVLRNDYSKPNDAVLLIGCYTAAGAPADSAFHVTYATTSFYQ
ncbi:RNA polymerase sigma factor, sigma-70 family [Actinokineospora alba]|uniref:RNA polymerase sigma factor, sigma-70 family n=1 Tax=Actinokineospora alba TaxID=504798 RepID=A0A1H0W4A9_9PSEU|nr:sigma-70 family RNA polymerase sigma factor [Actinokineospora alba]TDP67857.1 RNA polymerase sigma factor (sigma-70 family) [Actinokineospora alba]SDI73150.1 RNA polymerase sigma factor, sigma-70 family [Actinokineospora alba]SDP85564.1 RNA polymerase sigma factor, sigma-70 family [Actinokineospora alba]